MRAVVTLAATAVLALGTAGCGPGASDPATGGVSAKEAQALNDAAMALEDNGVDAATVGNVAETEENRS